MEDRHLFCILQSNKSHLFYDWIVRVFMCLTCDNLHIFRDRFCVNMNWDTLDISVFRKNCQSQFFFVSDYIVFQVHKESVNLFSVIICVWQFNIKTRIWELEKNLARNFQVILLLKKKLF